MAQIPVRLNTQQMAFPLLSQQSGRTLINPQGDLTYVKGVNADGDVPVARGIPGIMYAHNVMPSSYGWQGVGYYTEYPAVTSANALGTDPDFQQIKFVQGATIPGADALPAASGLRTYIARANSTVETSPGVFERLSSLYYIHPTTGVWTQISNSPTTPGENSQVYDISTAYINGYSYICIPYTGIYVFDVAAGTLTSRDLAGVDETTIEGAFASNGYLLVWSSRRVLWSSVINVEDFVPSDTSGAGGGALQEAEGAIVYCASAQIGFLVVTDNNIVSGVYTANENFPFEYAAVPSAGGSFSHETVSEDAIGGYHYAYTTNGIQRIAHTTATTVLSNVSDFIGNGVLEDFNDSTNALEQTVVTIDMPRALAVIANRYVVVSYSATADGVFTHAIVVDALQNRMGKLKIDHTQVFFGRKVVAGEALDPRKAIGFLQRDGSVKGLDLDLDCSTADAVLLMGKIQYVHQRMLQLQEVEVENVCPGSNFSLLDYPSLDGKTFEPIVQGYARPEDAGKTLKRYLFNNVAKSHSLLFRGTFELLSILVWFNVHGKD